jgi:Temperature dependent protein affecting M2 dsRNA replication
VSHFELRHRLISPKNQASFARSLRAIDDPKLRETTVAKDGSPVLKSRSEILFSVVGRFLQLRGFVNEKHELTTWGKALEKALFSLDSPDRLEDSVYLVFEMLRLGLLDDRNFLLGSTRSKSGKTQGAQFQFLNSLV